ncbi:hypothetical protein HY251_10760 [bacterium]|nr:hypothetical protein [bacterium]
MVGRPLYRAVLAAPLLLAASAALAGCIPLVNYTPDETAVEKLGPEEGRKRLQETMARAQDPKIMVCEATDDYVDWKWNQVIHGAYGIPVGTSPQNARIFYANLTKLELYENHNVYLYGPSDQLTAKVMYGNEGDAKLFMDLMASFRARRLKGK